MKKLKLIFDRMKKVFNWIQPKFALDLKVVNGYAKNCFPLYCYIFVLIIIKFISKLKKKLLLDSIKNLI